MCRNLLHLPTNLLLLGSETHDSIRWLANPNQGCIHYPWHDFQSSYEYLNQYQNEDSYAH